MPRSQKAMTVAAIAVVIGVVVAGTATAASTYIISKLSQISPSVRSALQTRTTAVLGSGHADPIGHSTSLVALKLVKVPAAVTGAAYLTNTGSSDAHLNCAVTLNGFLVSPVSSVVVPAATSGSPLGGGGSSANTVTLAFAAAPTKGGSLAITCTDKDNTGKVSGSGTLSAISVTSATLVVPKVTATPTATSSASASATPTTSASATPTTSGSATASSSTSSTASPSSTSSSSSCPTLVCP